MGVHPERAAKAQWEVVVRATARRDRWSGDAGYAVLLPGWGKAVPVDQARLIDPVFDKDAELCPDLGYDASAAARLADGEYRGRFAIDLDRAPLELEDLRRGGL